MRRVSSSAKQNCANRQSSCMIRKPLSGSCWPPVGHTTASIWENICIVLMSFVFSNMNIKKGKFVCNEVFLYCMSFIYCSFIQISFLTVKWTRVIWRRVIYWHCPYLYTLYTFLFLKYTVIPVVRYACAHTMSFSLRLN